MRADRTSQWLVVALSLTCLLFREATSCTVPGCQQCKDGYTDRCNICIKEGYTEKFTRGSDGVAYKLCEKQTSTKVILAVVLSVCGCILCLAIIFLFYWIQLKKLIAKNIEFFTSRRSELIKKKEEYEKEKRAHEPEIREYVRQKTDYDSRIQKMKDMRERIEELERRQQHEEEMQRVMAQQPQPPPMYNIFMEMERDYIQRQQELQKAQNMRLPPGFLDANPIPPPIQPITVINFAPSPFGPTSLSKPGPQNNQIYPPAYGAQPYEGGPQPFGNAGAPQPLYAAQGGPSPYQPAGYHRP